jgi:hypothetical protein
LRAYSNVASCEELDPILALRKSFGYLDNNHVMLKFVSHLPMLKVLWQFCSLQGYRGWLSCGIKNIKINQNLRINHTFLSNFKANQKSL